jgi:hypothetical protein
MNIMLKDFMNVDEKVIVGLKDSSVVFIKNPAATVGN